MCEVLRPSPKEWQQARDLKFSHVDVLACNLEEACAKYARVFSARRVSRPLVWERGRLHVRHAVVVFGAERFMLVQPLAGSLKAQLDTQGEGTIYRHCYSTPDIEAAYDELVAMGVQPEDENGKPLARNSLQSPSGARILWLPRRFGNFSIELLEETECSASSRMRLRALRDTAVGDGMPARGIHRRAVAGRSALAMPP